MTDASNMRGYLKLFERAAPDYVGKIQNPDITYSAEQSKGEITKVTAFLKSYESGRYTKLGRNLKRIELLEKRVKQLKEDTKQDSRELVADLFHAEDAACTRVVDTVSFVFQMSKDPKATETVKYSKVLEELQNHLTPELQEVLETLIEKHKSAPVQKAASLKATDKAATEESINEGLGDKLKGFFAKLASWVDQWGAQYDTKLDQLKAEVGMNESMDEGKEQKVEEFNEGDRVSVKATGEKGIVEKIFYVDRGFYYKIHFKNGQTDILPGNDLTSVTNMEDIVDEGHDDGTGYVDTDNDCDHDWHEGVDGEGNLVEPPYDICVNCGARRD